MNWLNVYPDNPLLHIMGRLDRSDLPLALDWTGTGLEFCFQGSDCWVELEATALSPVFWMIVLADGCPVSRFPVEPGCRFYPLLLGMDPTQSRKVTLMKETQCMPDAPHATILLRSIRLEGELLPLRASRHKIEFLGDSLTSGEGVLAPRDNSEWITPWFSAHANYSWYACNTLEADRSVLSQSGWGVCWDWEHNPTHNLSDAYDMTVGVLAGPEAEARGCRKRWNFSSWCPDIVCIRLLTNDVNGMNMRASFAEDSDRVIQGSLALIRKVHHYNPEAGIVWILPGSGSHPELGETAVNLAVHEGIRNVSFFRLPDYTPEEYGARAHPNAAYNRRAGLLLADYLRTLL